MTGELISVITFWLAMAGLIYTFIGYPVLIYSLSKARPRPVRKADTFPRVSLIIAAYNEERVIHEKLRNCFAMTYPRGQLEIIVVADGSSDRTAEIVAGWSGRGVQLMHEPARRGKSAALNRAVPHAEGEIVFFSDANTHYPPDVIEKMVSNFSDSTVGGVSGRKVLLQDLERHATRGETAYWGYESILKSCESSLGSIVTADGEIFALRKSLYEPIPDGFVHDDMFLTLSMVERGYRVVYESEATSAEHASRGLWDEFHLKVRYASAGYQVLKAFAPLLMPPRSLFALQFISHKVFRWMAPFFLIAALVSSGVAGGPFYSTLFVLQIAFYAVALAGMAIQRWVPIKLTYFPLYFCLGNTAALWGAFKYLFAGQSTLWRKAAR
ncbi:MAG: glycosyltransferase family 2 protein [Acidobacteriota bacterium]|nr:MAG: glycosyltransferase family 2 protein [Acidobacteriota bacterium]